MWNILCCLCTRSWTAIECCACCYAYYKIKSCCCGVGTKISNCFKDCFNSITKCCNKDQAAQPPEHVSTEVEMSGITIDKADAWPSEI